MMADQYNFSSFDQHPANNKYNFSPFDQHPAVSEGNVSNLEAGVRGLAQGATLGFADELTGAAEASPKLLDLLTGGGSLKDIKDAYTKARDESRANYKAAEDQHPVISTLGNIAGGFAPAILSGGLAPAAEGAGALAQMGNAAKIGAKIGAIQGAGSSNADLAQGDVGGLAKDVAGGAAGGAALGGAIEGGLQGVKGTAGYLKNLLNKSKTGSKVVGSYEMGQNGENLLNKATRESIGQEPYQAGMELAEKLAGPDGLKSKAGKTYNELLEQYKDHEISLEDAMPKLQDLIGQLDDRIPEQASDKKKLQNLLDNFTTGSYPVLDYQSARNLKGGLQDSSKFQKGSASSMGENVAGQMAKTVNEATEQSVPGLEAANDKFSGVSDLLKEVGVSGTDTSDAKKLAGLFQRNQSETITGDKKKFELKQLVDMLKPIDPKLADQVEANASKIGKRVEIARSATNEAFPGHSAVGLVMGGSVKGANVAGQASRTINNAFVKAPKEQLKNIATQLSTTGETGYKLGNILNKAADSDEIGRNALLFSAMQNSTYRELVKKHMGLED